MRPSWVPALAGSYLAAFLLGTNAAAAADVAQPAVVPVTPAPFVEQPYNFAAGLSVGTLGLGAELSAKVSPWMVVRVIGGGYGLSLTREVQDNSFSAKASLVNAGLIADFHVFSNGFRLSAGPTFQDFQASGSAIPASGSTITINGISYQTSQIGGLHASVTDNKLGGYFGIGYDAIHFAPGRFSLNVDLGGVYTGTPKINLTTDNSVPGLASNLQAEEQTIQGQLKYLSVYPVITIGAKYSF
jgi:hypothetical protein